MTQQVQDFKVVRDASLDFAGESYKTAVPNIHRYPATMIPQLGVELLNRHAPKSRVLLDPYCGSGSSFVAALEVGYSSLHGFDLNPLAVLITKAKFCGVDPAIVKARAQKVEKSLKRSQTAATQKKTSKKKLPAGVTNLTYWFSESAAEVLVSLRNIVNNIEEFEGRDLFRVALSATIRDVSYTRNNEFKLYRIPEEKIKSHNPDVYSVFRRHVAQVTQMYEQHYFPLLKASTFSIKNEAFSATRNKYTTVLTSPPYGDSRTTVAYGQFSTLANEWLGVKDARKIDAKLMGGRPEKELLTDCILEDQITEVAKIDLKRGYDVSAFYRDLGNSISDVAASIPRNGTSIYVVGNRRVKDVQLDTDQFIAQQFELHGLHHVITYERLLSNKVMPSVNSPSNKAGATNQTMTHEFIVVCSR